MHLIPISLVVATIYRTTEFKRLLESLKLSVGVQIDLVIVDQNSDERINEILNTFGTIDHISVNLLKLTVKNLSVARNLGSEQCKNELVAFPDDDCWYEPNALFTAAQYLSKQTEVGMLLANWVEHAAKKPPHPISISLKRMLNFKSLFSGTTFIIFSRRSIIEANPFDDRIGGYKERGALFGYGEDLDVILSIAKTGVQVIMHPEVLVHHPLKQYRFRTFREEFDFTRFRSRGVGALYAKYNLSTYVIIRGFVSSAFRSVTGIFKGGVPLGHRIGDFIGRIEGFIIWKRTY